MLDSQGEALYEMHSNPRVAVALEEDQVWVEKKMIPIAIGRGSNRRCGNTIKISKCMR